LGNTLPFDTPAVGAKLDALVDDPVVRAVLESRIGRERDMVRTNRALRGGSDTFENL
jgi:hypothetical protein